MAFAARLSDAVGGSTFANGMFRITNDGLETLAIPGDIVTDRQTPVTMGQLVEAPTALSDTGAVAFLANASPGGQGVFGHWEDRLHAVAVVGDLVELEPGEFRKISQVFGGSPQGFHPQFDAAGNLYIWAKFLTGETAILVTATPTPGTLGVVLCVGLISNRRRPTTGATLVG